MQISLYFILLLDFYKKYSSMKTEITLNSDFLGSSSAPVCIKVGKLHDLPKPLFCHIHNGEKEIEFIIKF